jgi:hypothetical protein
MFVCCECCVLSGRGLCEGLITRPEDSYRMWRVVVCVQEASKTSRLLGCENTITMGCNDRKTNKHAYMKNFLEKVSFIYWSGVSNCGPANVLITARWPILVQRVRSAM